MIYAVLPRSESSDAMAQPADGSGSVDVLFTCSRCSVSKAEWTDGEALLHTCGCSVV